MAVVAVAMFPGRVEAKSLYFAGIDLEYVKVGVSALGFLGTIVALLFAVWQFRRAEQWRRAEFLAQEMKDFLDDETVKNALLMLDWGSRWINLHNKPEPDRKDLVLVTRKTQSAALLPHTVVSGRNDSDAEAESGPAGRTFTRDEARIRDTYDALLDGLERFGSFLRGKLVTREQLTAYIGYWIRDLSTLSTEPDDIDWQTVLLAYVEFYHFTEVQYLFEAFGTKIDSRSRLFQNLIIRMSDRPLANALERALAPSAPSARG